MALPLRARRAADAAGGLLGSIYMLTICKIHNKAEHHCISTRLSEIMENNYKQECKVVKIIVHSVENGLVVNNHIYYATDVELSDVVSLNNDGELYFYDRDKIKKEANDRLVILKIKRMMTVMICRSCLDNMLANLDCENGFFE